MTSSIRFRGVLGRMTTIIGEMGKFEVWDRRGERLKADGACNRPDSFAQLPSSPMQDFTAGGISATPNKTQTTGNPKADELIKQLVCEWECTKSCELIEEMIITA